jgi:NAD(P)-dependent dehydrogenase (short-subunit alcohol dehydrogenase family)
MTIVSKSKRNRNSIDLSGRKAIVTGGAQGIGKDVAERLRNSGAKVAIWDLDAAELSRTASALDAHAELVDQTDWTAVQRAAKNTLALFGTIDILVNNAGIAGSVGPTWDYDITEWKRIVDVNLNGPFYCCKAILPAMRVQGFGRVVNVASIAGKEGNPGAAAYSASKAGLIALTKSLGKELADMDIAVNCVTPAAARTKMLEQVGQAHIDFMLSKIPRARLLELSEASSLIAWLVSDENSFATGAVFDLSGGRATY